MSDSDAPGGSTIQRGASAVERAVRRGLIGGVKAYRLLLSPVLGSSCRFTPTCSVYALQALERHGAGRGSYLTVRRLARCHPWCAGGVDEVPERDGATSRVGVGAPNPVSPRDGRPGLFSRLLSPSSQKKNS